MKISTLLLAVKELIKDPNTWAQKWSALNKDGLNVSPLHPGACKFCLSGAVFKVCIGESGYGAYNIVLLAKLEDHLPSDMRHIPTYNDTHTHAEVMEVLENTIKSVLIEEEQMETA